MRLALGVAAAAWMLAFGVAAAGNPAFNPANGVRGKRLAGACEPCHATPSVHAPKLSGQRPEAIFQALRDYKSGARRSETMSPLAAPLSDQDMRDLGAHLAAGGGHPPTTAVGAGGWAHEKVHRDCAHCHGEAGMGVMPGTPILAGQHADYLVHAMESYRSGDRTNATMAPIAAKLTPREIRLLADYFAAQKRLKVSE